MNEHEFHSPDHIDAADNSSSAFNGADADDVKEFNEVSEVNVVNEVDEFDELDSVNEDEFLAAALAAAREEFGDFDLDLAELADTANLPVVAIVGRPNVGKSTLVNRIIGRREAVVEDVPGVTRDRVSYEAEWNGRRFLVVDTGGWERNVRGIHSQIAAQAERAINEADVVMFVVDAQVGATTTDEAVVDVIRKSGKPTLLVATKADDHNAELEATALWGLGLGEPHPVSGLHGRGSGDLLDSVVAMLPEVGSGQAKQGAPRRVALLGKPNVGKSSLLNALAGSERVVVDDVAGTTVDPVDELVEIRDRLWWFVDTAGIRKRVKEASGHEYYATLRTQAALDRAEVAIVLIDASSPISEQDQRIISMVIEAGRALVIAFNKWDLTDEERRHYLEREIDRELAQVSWAPTVNISAKTKRHVEKLAPALELALDNWDSRIPTGTLNRFFADLTAAHPHPLRGGKQPRILFGTQVSACPPTFALFTTGFLEAGYRRFIERRLREEFGFDGTPIRVVMRVREKRSRR